MSYPRKRLQKEQYSPMFEWTEFDLSSESNQQRHQLAQYELRDISKFWAVV